MSLRRGELGRYDPTPIACFPRQLAFDCGSCSRFRPGLEPRGKVVVMDASSIAHKGGCPMWLATSRVRKD